MAGWETLELKPVWVHGQTCKTGEWLNSTTMLYSGSAELELLRASPNQYYTSTRVVKTAPCKA